MTYNLRQTNLARITYNLEHREYLSLFLTWVKYVFDPYKYVKFRFSPTKKFLQLLLQKVFHLHFWSLLYSKLISKIHIFE